MKCSTMMNPVRFALMSTVILAGAATAAPHYVGAKACAGCHKSEYADWQRSVHGKAMDLLAAGKRGGPKHKAKLDPDKDYSKDEKCLKCHATGYGKEGGYVDSSSASDLAGVGCEMCHGPGSDYREIHKQKMLDFKSAEVRAAGQAYASKGDKVCENCHDHKDSPFKSSNDKKYAFDLKERMGRGKNGEIFHEINPLEGNHN